MKVSIILASYDSGHYHGGCGQGPDALMAGGLAEALKLAGHDNERFPIVLAGNCLTSAGAVAGEGADAIIWADQHGDINTPDTSTSGFLDGMALATVLGLCWRPMTAQIPGFKPIDPA
ncbi:MAG: arginase family protein, partial [Mesorhizobium sp.]